MERMSRFEREIRYQEQRLEEVDDEEEYEA
jgi:hypothetical protein